ncbi:GxxExxY protein [soil metagenome]
MNCYEFRERGNSGVDPGTEDLAQRVMGAAIEVHSQLGPGHPESAYRNALAHEFGLRGISYEMEVPVVVLYKGKIVGSGRVDLIVERVLVLELKTVESITGVHKAQAGSYLAALNLQLALLINFNVEYLKNGIKRVVRTR